MCVYVCVCASQIILLLFIMQYNAKVEFLRCTVKKGYVSGCSECCITEDQQAVRHSGCLREA